jgi:pyridoxal phosphate enzyme (YggS family)
MELINRWSEVQRQIQQSCQRVGRDPRQVQVVAVTKYVDTEQTRQVLDAGLTHIGESRVQDAVPKWKELGDRGTWHFIGHLQRNKAKEVVGRFFYLHSLDRLSLATELDKRAKQKQTKMQCFIQVNVAQEKQKFGISPHELEDFAYEVANLSTIDIIGLMTMAPLTPDAEEVRPVFRELRRLQQKLQQTGHPRLQVPHLSMGMSQDYHVAIEEGATWVRLGSVLVGKRS